MKRLTWLILILSLGLGWHLASAQTTTLTAGEFWEKVASTWREVKLLQTQAPEAARPKLDELANEWAAITTIEVNGQRLLINTQWIQAGLRAEPIDLDQLDRELAAFYNFKDDWPGPRHTAADLRPLQTILARPEFQWTTPLSPLQEWWNNLLRQFQDWLNGILPADGLALEFFSWAFPVMAAIALVLVLAYILRGLGGGFSADALFRPQSAEDPLTSEDALQRAQTLSASGDYRTAVRYLYLAALLKLDERGLLRYDRSLTNREYVRRVSHKPQLAEHLREVVDVFDRVWYGFQPLDANGYAAYAQRVDELERLT